MNTRLLGIYLNDHLAGAVAGGELARRCRASNRNNEFEAFLDSFVGQVEADRATLVALMEALGIPPNPLKVTGAWITEKVGRLKLNGRLYGYSPLSRLEEVEGLVLGVHGKRALWRALKSLLADDTRAADVDFDHLIRRADSQRTGLERLRMKAAALAFTGSRPAARRSGATRVAQK